MEKKKDNPAKMLAEAGATIVGIETKKEPAPEPLPLNGKYKKIADKLEADIKAGKYKAPRTTYVSTDVEIDDGTLLRAAARVDSLRRTDNGGTSCKPALDLIDKLDAAIKLVGEKQQRNGNPTHDNFIDNIEVRADLTASTIETLLVGFYLMLWNPRNINEMVGLLMIAEGRINELKKLAKEVPPATQDYVYTELDEKLQQLTDETKLPKNYNVARGLGFELARLERDLFTDLEEKESKNAIVERVEGINAYDFYAFIFAAGKQLYNQSYKSGNTENFEGVGSDLITHDGNNAASGIIVTLNDLCRDAYGVEPTTANRKAMEKMLEMLHKNRLHINLPNGDKIEETLCATMDKYHRKADNATIYYLSLGRIFSRQLKINFGTFPQNATKLLAGVTKRNSVQHLKLLMLLGMQDKRQPYRRIFTELLKDMEMDADYKANVTRTEKRAKQIFKDMKDAGFIKTAVLEPRTIRGKKRIYAVTFTLK